MKVIVIVIVIVIHETIEVHWCRSHIQAVFDVEKGLGQRDPSTLHTLNSYASACFYQNTEEKYNEALDLFNQLLAMQKDVNGSDHPSTLNTMHCIGSTYYKLGRLTEASSMNVWLEERQYLERIILQQSSLNHLLTS